MQFWITLGLTAWAVLGPLASWGLTDLNHKWFIQPAAVQAAADKATAAEHQRGVDACNKRVAVIQKELSEKAAEARRLADEAEQSIGPTPVEKAELRTLCSKSASCRERLQKGDSP